MITVGIGGATGYGGVELVRLLSRHPQVRLGYLSSESYAGQRLGDVYPHLGDVDLVLEPLAAKPIIGSCQFALLALPAGKSLEITPALLKAGVRVIDVGPDYRLKDPAVYARWYKLSHTSPDLLAEAVYGIPELYPEPLRDARLVAAPGCYPTSALLAVVPLLRAGLIQADDLVVDSKSGVSGAGRSSLALPYHYPEADEDVAAYAVAGHRHVAEIEQEVAAVAGREVAVTFTPHLVPMSRGILSTIYAKPARSATAAELAACLREFYAGRPFVRVLEEPLPHTKWTAGSNYAYIAARVDEHSGRVILISALDNLGKGMSGQMVQCLNLMCGWEETLGLDAPGLYP
jgi:N-acetyl-gamma-glutamyl-phosphate reductase